MSEIKFNIVGDASGFKKAVADAKAGVSDAKRQIESEGQAMSEVFNKIGKTIGAVFTATMAKELVTNIAKVRGEFQQLEVSFRTMLGSADKANALMAQITQTAAITPFGLQDVANGAKQLLAYGMASEKVNETLIRLGDISAGLSIPLNDLVYLYGTTMTQGRLFTQDFRQFQGRGIPIAEELAKQFGVVKAEVGNLVTAGRVGFPEIEKAIISMTSEGGKFAGLMEAQSKTITGQISNLEDSIDSMFNEIGRANEEVISGAISMASSLVENYKTIGEILVHLVGIYGTYKTAVIATTAIENIRVLGLKDGIYYSWLQVKATKAMTIATQAYTKVASFVKAHPYALLATAVIGASYGIYKLATAESEAEKAQKKLNDAHAEMESNLVKEQVQLDSLFSKLKVAQKGTEQYDSVKSQIMSKYGDYLQKLGDEKTALDNIGLAYKTIREELKKTAQEKAMTAFLDTASTEYAQNVGNIRASIRKMVEETYKGEVDSDGIPVAESIFDNIISSVENGTEVSKDIIDKFGKTIKRTLTDATGQVTELNINTNPLEEKIKEIQRAGNIFKKAQQDAQTKFGQTIKPKGTDTGSEDVIYSLYSDEVAKLKVEKNQLQKEIQSIKNDETTYLKKDEKALKAIEDRQKRIKEIDDKLGTSALNKAQSAQAKADEKALNEEEKRGEELLDLTRKTEDNRLAIKKESRQKELEVINTAYQRELEDMNKIEAEWKKAQGGKLTQEQTDALAEARGVASAKAQYDRNEVNEKYWKAEADAMNEYLIEYGTYQQKREAIADKYNKQIAEAETEGQKKILQKQMENELSELDISANKTTSIVSQLFGDMTDKSLAELRRLQTEGKKALDFLTGGQWNEQTGKDLGITKDMFNTISADQTKLAELQKILKDLTDDVKALENPFKQMKMGFGDMFKNLKDPKKFSEALNDVVSAMNKISQAGSFVSDSIRSLGNAFGSDTFGAIADGMDMALGAMDSAMQGAQAGAVFGAWGAVAGAAIGLVSSLGESIAELHDNKKEAKIVAFQEQIDGLQKRYDKLGDAIERAYSADASGLIEEQNKMLAKQRELISQQITEEQDKKNADQSRINEWTDKMEEVSKQIEENKREAIEAMTGTDITSAIDSFATALADAWENGTDSAYESVNVVKKLLRTGIVEYIKKVISPDVEALMGNMANYLGDGVISEYEQALLEAEAKAIANKSDQLFSTAKKAGLLTDEASSGTSGGVSAMTQETAEELNGRFTAMQISMEAMRTSTQVMQGALGGLIAQITPAIAVTTESSRTLGEIRDLAIQRNDYLADIAKYTKGNLAEVTSMAKEIVKIKDKL